tara:strand:+ start:927 stop:1397 length:471 start_codon:yes stop_codon:yes gene_type:complete
MLELTTIATLVSLSWLIPAAPLGGAILIAGLLVSFTRTINRLTKPISLFLIACIAFSTLLSLLFFLSHISGQSFQLHFDISTITLNLSFYVNEIVEKALIIFGTLFLLSMIFSFYALDRQKGYVRYMVGMSFLCSLIFCIILTNDSFRFVLEGLPL